MPKVSIILPIYNVEKYLRECLDSLVNQTLKDIEIICVNDGSPDNSLEILKEYAKNDNRIKIIDQKNQGTGIARNNGIDIAAGEYLGFVDPDDYCEPDMFEKLYNSAKQHDADIAEPRAIFKETDLKNELYHFFVFYANGQKFPEDKVFDYKDDNINRYCMFIHYAPWNLLCRSSLIKENDIRFWDSKSAQDQIFAIQARYLASRVVYLNSPLYHYRDRNTSSVHTASPNVLARFGMFDAIKDFFIKSGIYEKIRKEFEIYLFVNSLAALRNCPKELLPECDELTKNTLSDEYYKKYLEVKKLMNLPALQKLFFIGDDWGKSPKDGFLRHHKVIYFMGLKFKIRIKTNDEKKRNYGLKN